MAITTIAEYKVWNPAHGASDAELTVMLGVAEAAIQRYCGRTFTSATFTDVVNGTGTEALVVRNPPITSITSIKSVDNDGTAGDAWATSSYKLASDDSGVIHRLPYGRPGRIQFDSFGAMAGSGYQSAAVFPEGVENIQVIYVGGYATIPEDIKWAEWTVVDDLLSERGQDATMQSETLGSYSYTRVVESGSLSIVRQVCAMYRRTAL